MQQIDKLEAETNKLMSKYGFFGTGFNLNKYQSYAEFKKSLQKQPLNFSNENFKDILKKKSKLYVDPNIKMPKGNNSPQKGAGEGQKDSVVKLDVQEMEIQTLVMHPLKYPEGVKESFQSASNLRSASFNFKSFVHGKYRSSQEYMDDKRSGDD